MKKINLYIKPKDLEGNPLYELDDDGKRQEIVATKFVATLLARGQNAKDPLRQLEIAQKMHKAKGSIELEDADFELVKKAVEDSTASCILIAQILPIIENAGKETERV